MAILRAAIRPDPSRKSAVQYRAYCALHSAAQEARDHKVWQERMEKQAVLQQVRCGAVRCGEAGVLPFAAAAGGRAFPGVLGGGVADPLQSKDT